MSEITGAKGTEAVDTPEEHQSLIKSQWRDFAAFAWRRYQTDGRGAVVVDLRNPSTKDAAINVSVYYVADGSERLAALGGWPGEEIAGVIREYDPEEEVVFVFLRITDDVVYYRVSDDLTPPRA